MAAQSAALLVVALASPPNTVDSLLYHMARVVHWAQQGSLRFFPTAYAHQLFMPPWAETVLLQLRLLAGSDRLANLLQWASFVASAAGAFSLAGMMGAGLAGRLLAAAFVVSTPMAVLQATSTQNDLVTALWLVVLAHVVVWDRQRELPRTPQWEVGAAWGLGLLTKATFYVYSAPLLVWAILSRLKRSQLPRTVAFGLTTLLIVLAVNLGHWARNIQAFGSPLGPKEAVEANLRLPSGESGGVGRILAAEVQMVSRNLVTPLGSLNRRLYRWTEFAPGVFGPDFAQEMQGSLWNHEDTAGNPLHLALAIGALAWTLLRGRTSGASAAKPLAAAVLCGYLLLPIAFPNAASLIGVRFQLPFLVLSAPIVGLVLDRWIAPRVLTVLALALIVFSTPWVLFNNTRPLIGLPGGATRTGSVLAVPDDVSLFAMYTGRLDEYEAVTQRVRDAGCRDVGLRLDSHDPEYVFWWLLNAPQSGVRIEDIDPPAVLARYQDPSFRPCAVICTVCGSEGEVAGLPLGLSYQGIRLFLSSDATP